MIDSNCAIIAAMTMLFTVRNVTAAAAIMMARAICVPTMKSVEYFTSCIAVGICSTRLEVSVTSTKKPSNAAIGSSWFVRNSFCRICG